jgi:hypothetical protein
MSPGESLDLELDWRDGSFLDVASLGASRLETWLEGPLFAVLWFLPLFEVDLQGRYACQSWRVQDGDFSGLTKFCHFSFRWCVDKQSHFEVVVLLRCPAPAETRICLLSLGQALSCCCCFIGGGSLWTCRCEVCVTFVARSEW